MMKRGKVKGKERSRNYFLNILRDGETVVSITDRIITVRDEMGDAYGYWYHFDKNGTPVIEDRSLMVTSGNGVKEMCYDAVGSEDLPF